ncbi:hypothetical protein [Aeromonas schubertii]|uniref:hypothetical protein n=1 Tax=Aeromonas schubertii TaxID=652 RepID=UPI0010A7E75D|nr:hypothetical protein [Aeromonas schubertii]QCG47278.1 hypothetical protein E2P79_04905 [Aeromonas schubertii]
MKYFLLIMFFLTTTAHAEQYIIDSLGYGNPPLYEALTARAQQLTLSDDNAEQHRVLIVNTDDGIPSLNKNDFVHADTIILMGKENERSMIELLGYGVSAPLVIIHNANDRDRREISKMTSVNMGNQSMVAEKIFEQISRVNKE